MLENVTVMVNGEHFPTRLHEHGRQPLYQYQPSDEWKESGYMEGTEEGLNAIKEEGKDTLEFYKDGVLYAALDKVIYDRIDCMYDDHYIMHLDWD